MADQQQSKSRDVHWSRRDTLVSISLVVLVGTILTAVIGTTLIGGGGFLLLISPLLILFSPILVPALILFAIIAGGATTFAAFIGGVGAIVAWVYNYVTGGRPYGAESADVAVGKTKEVAGQIGETLNQTKESMWGTLTAGKEKAQDTLGQAKDKAGQQYGYLQQQATGK